MENKFKFLTKYSLLKKLKNKWFLVANIIVLIVIVPIFYFWDDTRVLIHDDSYVHFHHR